MLTNNPRIVTDGIKGCWDPLMPDTATAATKLYDDVGSADGTMYCGSCLDFDGTDDHVDNTSFSSHQVDSGTIVVWANPRSIGSDGYVLSVGGAATLGANRCIRDTSGKWSLVTYGSGGTEDYNNFGPSIVTGQWYHLAFVWSGTSATAYVDGVAYSTTLSGMITPTGTVMAVGRAPWSTSSGTSRFDGQAADARVYNVALSAANIKELYDDSKVIIPTKNDASGGFVTQTNLIGWWPLGDGAGTIAYDGSGNGNDGTLTNMTSADWLTGQTGAPQLVEGYNRAMLFDGSSDSVELASDITLASDYTIACWVLKHTQTAGWKGIISTDYTPRSITLEWYDTSSKIVAFTSSNGSSWDGGSLSTATGLNMNQWYHVAFTGTGGAGTLYLDGSVVATGTAADPIYNSTFETPAIGEFAGGGRFGGIINEVVVYNAAISGSDIQLLAATGPNGGPLPADPTTLGSSGDIVGYWRNDNNVTWTDRVGSNTGTVSGSPVALLFKQGYNGQKSTSTGRDGQGFPLSRQNNGAIGFDGTTTYTDAGSVGGAGTFSNCTISVWVNPRNIVGATSHGRIYDGNYEPSIRQRGPTLQLNGTVSASQTYLFYLGADVSNYFSAGNMTAPKGQWTNITMTVTTIGTTLQSVNGYVNLTLEGTGSTTDSAKMWVGDIGNLRIGQGYKTGQRFFVGQIGNLQIWDRVLPLSEITQNFNAQRSRFGI